MSDEELAASRRPASTSAAASRRSTRRASSRRFEGARPRRGDDRRRRERRAGAQARRHRHRHGHHRHRRRQGRRPTWCSPTTTSPASSRAVEQGRIIYANIRKFVYFLLSLQRRRDPDHLRRDARVGLPMPLLPAAAAVAQPGHRRRAGAGARDGEGRPRHHAAARRGRRRSRVINRDMAIGIVLSSASVDVLAILGVFYLACSSIPASGGRADDGLRDAVHVRAVSARFAARSEFHSVFSIGVFSQPLDGRGRGRVVRARARGRLRAVPGAILRRRAADIGDWLVMLPFFFASPLAMELLKVYFRTRRPAGADAGRASRAAAAGEGHRAPVVRNKS